MKAVIFSLLAFVPLAAKAEDPEKCAKILEVLEHSDEWLAGDLNDLHDRVLCTYEDQENKWENQEGKALALKMRTRILQFMIERHRKPQEVVKYLAHYAGIAGERPGFATLGFIPRALEAKALALIAKQAPNLSREELAQVVAFESAQRVHSGKQVRFSKPLLDRIQAEKDPRFVADILHAIDKYPYGDHKFALELIAQKSVDLPLEVLLSLVGKDGPKVLAQKQNPAAAALRQRLVTLLAKHAGTSDVARALVLANIRDGLPASESAPLAASMITMLSDFARNAPMASVVELFDTIKERSPKHPLAPALVLQALSLRSSEDLVRLSAAKVSPAYKDYAIKKIHERVGKEGHARLGESLLAYYQGLDVKNHESAETLAALRDYAVKAKTDEVIGLLLAAKNGPALVALLDVSKGFDAKAQLLPIYRKVAELGEMAGNDAYNLALARWKLEILARIQEKRFEVAEADQRELIAQLIRSLDGAKAKESRDVRNAALLKLAQKILVSPLATDSRYADMLAQLVNEKNVEDYAAHYAAIRAYRTAGGKDAEAVLAKALAAALQDKDHDRIVNLYLGLSGSGEPVKDESTAMSAARAAIRARFAEASRTDRARSLAMALRLLDGNARGFSAEIGRTVFDFLRFDLSPSQSEVDLKAKLEVVGKLCLEPGVAESFPHLLTLCGFPGGPEIRGLRFNVVGDKLENIVAELGRDSKLGKAVEELMGKIERRAEELEKAHAVKLGAAGNLREILCVRKQGELPEFLRFSAPKTLTDAEKQKLCAEKQGVYVDPLKTFAANSPPKAPPAAEAPPARLPEIRRDATAPADDPEMHKPKLKQGDAALAK